MKTQIISVRPIEGNKYSVAFAQEVITKSSSINLLALANEGDSRFTQNTPKATYAWMSFTKEGLKSMLDIDVNTLTFVKNEKGVALAVINKEAPAVKGVELNIQINETIGPKKKQDGTTLDPAYNRKSLIKDDVKHYFQKDGALVYRYATLVPGEAKHSLVEGAEMVNAEEFDAAMNIFSEASDNLIG